MGELKQILVIVSVPFYKSSGSPLAIMMKVKAFSELGYKVDLICYPHGEDISLPHLKIIRAPKRRWFKDYLPGEFRKKLVYDFFVFLRAGRLLFRNDYKFVVVVGSMIYYGRLLKLFSNKKFIAIEHGNLKTELEKWEVIRSNRIGNIFRKLEIRTLNSYSMIFSEAIQNIQPLVDSGLNEKKVYYLRMSSLKKSVLRKTHYTENFIVMYTGTFVKIQNLDLIYSAAALLRNEKIEFRFIGGEENQVDEEIEKNKFLPNVKFFYRLPQDEFEEFFSEADIVISARTFGEDCPQKIVDYLNFGKCILASDAKLHRELLNEQNSYLTSPDPASLAAAILYLRDNPELRESLSSNGKKFFEEELSFDIMKTRLEKVLFQSGLLNYWGG